MLNQDCFIFVDTDIPEKERTVSFLHVECQQKHMPGVGWFYKGSVEGYGPYNYKCFICGELIHCAKGENEEELPPAD